MGNLSTYIKNILLKSIRSSGIEKEKKKCNWNIVNKLKIWQEEFFKKKKKANGTNRSEIAIWLI